MAMAIPVCCATLQASVVVAAETTELDTQVCVGGGGSGGVSAALAAARAGASVVLVERSSQLGGTSTAAYVSSWEPGPGDSFALELYERLCKANAAGVTSDRNPDRKQGPYGFWLITPEVGYEQTLRRAGIPYGKCHGVVFDPEQMSRVMAELLAETGKCRVLLGTQFVTAELDGARVAAIKAQSSDGTGYRIRAKVFVDSTGNVDLCRAAGCEIMLGAEPKSRFGEPSAPEKADRALNALSLCYRIRKAAQPVAPGEPAKDAQRFTRAAHVTAVPGGGDLLVNPLGVLPGETLIDQGYEKTYEACKPVVQAHWRWLHGFAPFAQYEFVDFAPMLGIRESYRVVGEYVLTQQDLTAGLAEQKHPDIIAVADHPMDVHGSGRGSTLAQVKAPYGVPYRCLVPKGKENLLVGCRGASFSQIAASSCRLSRTMIAIGHAAGLAAAQAAKADGAVSKVDVKAMQKEMQMPLATGTTTR